MLAGTDVINNDSESLQSDATLLSGDRQQIIVIQTVRGLLTAPRDLTYKMHLKLVRQIWQMPSYIAGIKQSITRQAELLDRMTTSLGKALKTDVSKSPVRLPRPQVQARLPRAPDHPSLSIRGAL